MPVRGLRTLLRQRTSYRDKLRETRRVRDTWCPDVTRLKRRANANTYYIKILLVMRYGLATPCRRVIGCVRYTVMTPN